jgi:porin
MKLDGRTGFSVGMDYSAVTMKASETLRGVDDSASAGMVRLYGRWNLTGDGQTTSGGVVYKFENRHDYGDPAPSGFYLGNVGYAGLNAPPFSDQGSRVTNLYWRQSLQGGRTVMLGGFLDATDFIDVYGMASPWPYFDPFAHSAGQCAPDAMANVDSRKEVSAPNGWGANFSWSHYYNNRIMPFIRAGYTDDSGSLLEKSVSVGFGFQPDSSTAVPGDLFGAAINWGEVNDLSFGPGLDDQYTLEVFYRWQLTPRLAITSDLQYLVDPALNPDEDSIYVWAFRGRLSI